ncbi:MAG TPA: 2OG-Fe dioxygenase family protein [Pseudonocardiaceae bacterium]|nr:2OG-Fe dioxygenase family protein [Pseudonocardiaceae bacterium]
MSVDVLTPPDRIARATAWGRVLAADDVVVVRAAELTGLFATEAVVRLARCWELLGPDEALVDGGTYRYRRYGRLRAERDAPGHWRFTPLPHVPFRQSAEHVPHYGGRARMFGPIPPTELLDPTLVGLVAADLDIAGHVATDVRAWEIGLHMVRVVAVEGAPGSPTPESRHRDGHDFVGMHLLNRTGCTGGSSTIYPAGRPPVRLTMTDRLDTIIVVDPRLTHEVSPVSATDHVGVRDMLLVDLNAR